MGPALRLTPLSPACGSHRSGKLYAWRFNAAPKSDLSSPGARAGAGSVGGWVWSRGPPLSPGGSETGLSTRASSGSALPEGFAKPRHEPEVRPVRLCALAASSSPGSGSLQDKSCRSPRLVPRPRGIRRRVDPVPKSPLPRRPFGLCLGRANPRLDDWKVQRATDSGKRGTVHLSTWRLNASGQEWITQQLGAERRDYPLSRCESSRKRSALSLMKPAASCWS